MREVFAKGRPRHGASSKSRIASRPDPHAPETLYPPRPPSPQRSLWSSSSALADAFPSPPPPQTPLPADEPVFGARAKHTFKRSWNNAVDQTFGDLTKYLSDRRL